MAREVDRAHVRLVEPVAALSLGVDLGFGQRMEHVRRCLIALRLAERDGLDGSSALKAVERASSTPVRDREAQDAAATID